MAEKINPFYKLLKVEAPINITSELKETLDSVNNAPRDAGENTWRQPTPEKQAILMTGASFKSAGYTIMIENNSDQKIQSTKELTRLSRSDQKSSHSHNSWQFTRHSSSLLTFCGKHQNLRTS